MLVNEKYYAVTAKCGHVRRSRYLPVTFAIKASSRKEAARICKVFKRVKHEHKDAIINCVEISYEEYIELLKDNRSNPYLHSKNVQEQNRNCPNLSEYIKVDHHNDKPTYPHEDRSDRVKYKKRFNDLKLQTDMNELKFELDNY